MKLYSQLFPKSFRLWVKHTFYFPYFKKEQRIERNAQDEVVIVSFPKCGRSWLALMICDAVYNAFPEADRIDDVSSRYLYKINSKIPSILFSHDDQPMLKTPSELENEKFSFVNKKVIFLVRDPRDVIVSWFFQCKERGSVDEFEEPVKCDLPGDFLTNERGGLKSLIAFYNLWWENRFYPGKFLLVKYEALRKNPEVELKRIFGFSGMSNLVTAKAIKEAIDHNEFKKVQEREKRNEIKAVTGHNVFGTVEGKKSVDSLKARRGKVGGYKDYFDEKELTYLNAYISKELNPIFGYNENTELHKDA